MGSTQHLVAGITFVRNQVEAYHSGLELGRG